MNPQPHEERAVGRLRNDVDDIYEILGVIEGTLTKHSTRLDEHTTILNEHSATLAEHTTILSEHSVTLAEHTTKLDHIIDLLEAS